MTKPVAYMWKTAQGTITGLAPNDNSHSGGRLGIPLYTAEHVLPRVKMTKKQYDRLMWDKENSDLLTCLEYFLNSDGNNHFGLPSENLKGNLTQEDIARVWLNPDETIEIVPETKWFVRSKEKYQPDMGQGISESGYLYLMQGDIYSVEYHEMTTFKDDATQFNTEDEAKLWTTPDTEAVQLPVEGE